MNVWELGSIKRFTGKDPTPTRWVDVNKGDSEAPEIRSRFVVCETKRRSTIESGVVAAVFAAFPPIAAVRFLGSFTMSTERSKGYILRFLDVARIRTA